MTRLDDVLYFALASSRRLPTISQATLVHCDEKLEMATAALYTRPRAGCVLQSNVQWLADISAYLGVMNRVERPLFGVVSRLQEFSHRRGSATADNS